MISEEPEDDFYEDFGTQPPSETEIEEMLVRARAVGDASLRRTLKYHLALRHISEQLLRRVEEDKGEGPDPLLKLSRFLIRGEGALGNEPPLRRAWWKLWQV